MYVNRTYTNSMKRGLKVSGYGITINKIVLTSSMKRGLKAICKISIKWLEMSNSMKRGLKDEFLKDPVGYITKVAQ
ncbi:MAG: hypothetical protein DRO09_01520 [Thermoprotei archaeon]|nr:MAG: hypothetical protein DRO09_01520 [Thermoprotei archaeon]